MNSSRQLVLLIVVGTLIAAKFIVMPAIDWQSEQLERLELANKRLTSGMLAIEKAAEYQTQATKIEEKVLAIQNRLFPYQPETLFRLEQQSWLENLFNKFDIRAESISWSPTTSFGSKNVGIYEHKLDVILVGAVDHMVNIHSVLEHQNRAVRFESFNWIIERHLAKNVGTARGSATLVLYSQSPDSSTSNSGGSNDS